MITVGGAGTGVQQRLGEGGSGECRAWEEGGKEEDAVHLRVSGWGSCLHLQREP